MGFTVLYPFLDTKGTAYISCDKKNEKEQYSEHVTSEVDENGQYFFALNRIDKSDIKHADRKKIFVFLCRNASADLGKEYHRKSLIHAVPVPDNLQKPRIFITGRFAVANKKLTQP